MADMLTLRDCVDIFNLDCDTSKRTVNIVCPVCGKGPRDRKLNINFDRYGPNDGAFRCVRCGVEGRPLHFWAMMRGLNTDNLSVAAKDYFNYIESNDIKIVPKVKKMPVQQDIPAADIKTRDATYNALLNNLSLSQRHRAGLRKRGLSDSQINALGYKTYPATSLREISEMLLSQGYIIKGVPGFHQDEAGKWTLRKFSGGGFLIPMRNGFGQIQGLQLRLDDPSSGAKYLTVSTSEMRQGAKGRAFCHIAKGNDIEDIILTEGPLKADIISVYTGKSVVAIPGVNALTHLKRALYDLKNAGTKRILIAFDMDMYDNKHVMKAFENLRTLIKSYNLPYAHLVWDKAYKGLDDFLLAKKGENK